MRTDPTPATSEGGFRPGLRVFAILALAALLLVPVIGCRQIIVGGPRDFQNENDRLRAANLRLHRQVESFREQLERREGQLASLRQQLETVEEPIDGADPPVLSRLQFSRYTGPVDLDGDDQPDVVRIYLRTLDQRGRMLPVSGLASARLVHIPDDAEPAVIAQRDYGPEELDATYREGFTGVHYTLELEMPGDLPPDADELLVRVRLRDAATGNTLRHQQVLALD